MCLNIWINKSVVTWYPRNDIFFSTERKNIIKTSGFNIIYSPSWRHWRGFTKFFPFKDFDIDELIKFLEKNKINIFLRPHKNDLIKYKELRDFFSELTNKSKNIQLATHDLYPDVNEILPDFDAMISDYSAIYHDFLLLDKPLLFIPYDFDDFENQNWFLYNYKEKLPGALVKNIDDFYVELNNLINKKDVYYKQRKELGNLVHTFKDWDSSKRVYDLILDLIKNR